jgi:phage gp29-like protein
MANKIIGRHLLKNVTPPKNYDEVVIPMGGQYGVDFSILGADIKPEMVYQIVKSARSGNINKLYQLYRVMETTDPRYAGLLDSIKSAISGMPIKVIPEEGRTDAEKNLAQEYAALVEESLMLMDTHNIVRSFLDAVVYGARVFELVWDRIDLPYRRKAYVVTQVRGIPVSKMVMEMDRYDAYYGQIKLLVDKETRGRPLDYFDEGKVILVQNSDGTGEYDLTGVARRCIGWWLAKVFVTDWWAKYLETYGEPWRIGRYPAGSSAAAKNTMRRFLENIGRNAWGLFPENMQVQLMEANRQGTVTAYDDFIKTANREMTIALVGQLDTTGDQRQGSYARTEITSGIRHEILQNMAKVVEKGFDELIHYTLKFNCGDDYDRRLAPSVRPMIVHVAASKTTVDTYNAMQKEGIPVPAEQYYLQTGVPSPKKGETVIINGQLVTFNDFQNIVGGGTDTDTGSGATVPDGEASRGGGRGRADDSPDDQGTDGEG